MLYRDLVQFEPISSVIQLKTADDKAFAAQLVRSYVVSQRMAEQLQSRIIPQLDLDRGEDNKGMLVVGNYGTGKSHLMSLISAVAEHADLLDLINDPILRDAMRPVAGRFQVLRIEIGGVQRPLRDILFDELAAFLREAGTPGEFPPMDQTSNNKTVLIRALAGFTQTYPQQGILLVVDELLDYLRSREDRQLILDLGILRELGEVSRSIPLRFMGGLQETLFDNPRLSFVGGELRRVRDRFEQLRIDRTDISFVVAQRLLRKTQEQRALVAGHLRQFTTLYPPLAERLDEFVDLYPIHPAYIETFAQVVIAEKREVLKVLSTVIGAMLDTEVPAHLPGTVSYDHYWAVLTDNPSLRSLPDVIELVTKSRELENRIQHSYTRPPLRPLALRIIHALSVHRLTTSDRHAPVGVTATELCNQLFLWADMPEMDTDFLVATTTTALREIIRTVSGQYITHNRDNDQYYINLKQAIDFDVKIEERGAATDLSRLNLYFYDAIQRLLEFSDTTYVTDFRLWLYELPWYSRNVTRRGYFFLHGPNERSTAQPPRDFYIFIEQPFTDTARKRYVGNADEVVFALRTTGEAFVQFATLIRTYAGARLLTQESPTYRAEYQAKADATLHKLLDWLREHLRESVEVNYEGKVVPLREALAKLPTTASTSPGEQLTSVAAMYLQEVFAQRYPDYPIFPRLPEPITEANRPRSAMEAIRTMLGTGNTQLGRAVLDGLHLRDTSDTVKPLAQPSPYAAFFLQLLKEKQASINYSEVMEQVAGGLQPVVYDRRFKLEPEWVLVVLVALVYDDRMTLTLNDGGKLIEASNVQQAGAVHIESLCDFRFYSTPRHLPEEVWVRIFEGFGLQAALVRDEETREGAVRELQRLVERELAQISTWLGLLERGMTLWSTPIFATGSSYTVQPGQTVLPDASINEQLSDQALKAALRATQKLLEELARYDKPGKLRNLKLTRDVIDERFADRQLAHRFERLNTIVNQLQPLTAYLGRAMAILPPASAWVAQATTTRTELLAAVRALAANDTPLALPAWEQRLRQLKQDYIQFYSMQFRRYVLSATEASQRTRLLDDARLSQLEQLAEVSLLNRQEVQQWRQAVERVPVSETFYEGVLEDDPLHDNFRPPATTSASALEQLRVLEDRLATLFQQWHQTLRANLQSDNAQQTLALMKAAERAPIDTYLAQTEPPDTLPYNFVAAVNRVLAGLQLIELPTAALLDALRQGGLPCTVEELRSRFEGYVKQAMSGYQPQHTRISLTTTETAE